MGYFNFFDEWAMDPKVQSLPESLQRRHAMLLCLRNIGETFQTSNEEIATFMRISLEEVCETKRIFFQKGFIDGDGWNVTNWDKRQSGGCESLERVRRFRAKQALQRNVTEALPESVTPLHSNVTSRAPVLTYLHTNLHTKETPLLSPPGGATLPIPDWVPREDWDGWLEVRRAKKKPLTERALVIALNRLEKFRAKGHSPAEILQAATLGCWTGLHIPDELNGHQGRPVKHEKRANAAAYSPAQTDAARWRREDWENDQKEIARQKQEEAEKAQRARERAGKPTDGLVGESDA